jgi:hypothetical protein
MVARIRPEGELLVIFSRDGENDDAFSGVLSQRPRPRSTARGRAAAVRQDLAHYSWRRRRWTDLKPEIVASPPGDRNVFSIVLNLRETDVMRSYDLWFPRGREIHH